MCQLTSGKMLDTRLTNLCIAITSGAMQFTDHYAKQLMSRPTPNKNEIKYITCDDTPEIIENEPDGKAGRKYTVWGMADWSGRIGHVICTSPPNPRVITAYYPEETQPYKWTDDYRRRA